MSQILVVDNDAVGLGQVLSVLTEAGYLASGASTFEEAKRALANGAPDLLITNERLGAYNGLHVILRARSDYPDMSAIITTPVKNRGLEADARNLNVQCLIKPQNPGEWLVPIWKMLNEDHVDRVDGPATVQSEDVMPSIGRI